MDVVLKALGFRLRAYRKHRGLTQDEVAERAGVSQSYIGSVERGEQNLTIVSLVKLLRVLDMQFDELFGEIDTSQSDSSRYILNEITAKLHKCSTKDQEFALQFIENFMIWKSNPE